MYTGHLKMNLLPQIICIDCAILFHYIPFKEVTKLFKNDKKEN